MLSTRKRVIMWGLGGAATLLFLTASSCDSPARNPGQDQAEQVAQNRDNYIPTHDVEGHNYNARLKIADNPATLLWCTAYPANPNAKAFTVPIVGKLTSGSKRPYPTNQAYGGKDATGYYNTDLPGSDGMYGASSDYRYGFDPAGNYHDFYGIETYCTTVPTIIQKQETVILVKNQNADLSSLDRQVEAELAKCRAALGTDDEAQKKYSAGESISCPAAAALLGITP